MNSVLCTIINCFSISHCGSDRHRVGASEPWIGLRVMNLTSSTQYFGGLAKFKRVNGRVWKLKMFTKGCEDCPPILLFVGTMSKVKPLN
jgi:hypothetical protein